MEMEMAIGRIRGAEGLLSIPVLRRRDNYVLLDDARM